MLPFAFNEKVKVVLMTSGVHLRKEFDEEIGFLTRSELVRIDLWGKMR